MEIHFSGKCDVTRAKNGCRMEQTRQNADRVKHYWEVKANNLSAAGRSWGCIVSVESEGRDIFVIHAHRNGEGFSVRADKILTAFLELERARANIAWSKK